MVASIPASALVAVTPSVVIAGGSAIDLSGLVLTGGTRVPIGAVLSFPTLAAVGQYFGATSPEYAFAQVYFSGFVNSNVKPGALLFAQYPAAPVGAYLRGGSVATLTLPQLQAISGTLTVTVDGVVKSGSVNLSAATSFSNAATIIATALAGPTVTYDAQSGAFVIGSTTTGPSSTITFATGAAATPLKLATGTGAVTSQGAATGTPAVNLPAIIAQAQNFASITLLTEPSTPAAKLLFLEWNSAQNNRFGFIMPDSTTAAVTQGDTTNVVALARGESLTGYMAVWDPANPVLLAAAAMSVPASLNFQQLNGRATFAFRAFPGITPGVTDATSAATLVANGFNFYGSYATANAQFTLFQPGSIGGPFKWGDSFFNQIKLNADLQLAGLNLMAAERSIAFSPAGYARVEAALQPAIVAAVNFGTIRAGVTLSADQIAAVNAQAGTNISDTLQQRGWYVQIIDAPAGVRASRGPLQVIFWYVDGGSVQSIAISSINVQ